jgi:FMN phosphatase YigB (HAD superfamily)
MHKAILFDLGRVLVHFDFQIGYSTLEGLCGYPAAEIPKRLAPSGLVERFESGRVEPRAFFDEFRRTLAIDLEFERFCEIWSSIFTHPILPESLLEGLSARYRMVLLSNTNALHFQMIRKWYPNLLRHFDALVLSYEVGAMKPHAAIFEAAIRAAGCAPEECFYTDDIPAYVDAARAKGIDGVVFESPRQLEEQLRTRGIDWQGSSVAPG